MEDFEFGLVLYMLKKWGVSRPPPYPLPSCCDLWCMVFTLFGIHWVMPKMMVELLAYWKGKFGQNRNGVIWMIVPHCLMWCIWLERND